RAARHGAAEVIIPADLVRIAEAAVMPNQRRVLVRRRLWIKVVVLRRYVALLGDVDAPEMTDPLLMLRVLTHADINLVVVDDRRSDEVAAGSLATQLVHRRLGIAIELPNEFAGLRLE